MEKDETVAEICPAESRKAPFASTASANGPAFVGKGDPATGASAPLAWILKLAIVLLVKSEAYRNWPFGSVAIPVMFVPAVNGEPAISVRVPSEAIENAEIVPETPLET